MRESKKTTSQLSEKLCDATSALEELEKATINFFAKVVETVVNTVVEFSKALWCCLASSIEDKKFRKFYYLSEHGKNARIRKKNKKKFIERFWELYNDNIQA